MELSITEIDQLISTLLQKWFPIVETSVRHGGYVFGGVLRELWAAIRSFRPQKGVLIETHVTRHMEFYFQHGGDIDISIGEEEFEEAFSRNNLGYGYGRDRPVYVGGAIEIAQIFAEHNKITEIKLAEDPYEITKIVKRCVRDKMEYEGSGYKGGYHDGGTSSDEEVMQPYFNRDDRYSRGALMDRETQKVKTELFPTRHYMMKVESIFGIVNVDIIIVMKTGTEDDASEEKLKTTCDFTCNLLKYGPSEKKSDDKFVVVTSRDENVDLETVDQDISNNVIRVLGDHTNHMKVLHRLVKRLETADMYGNRRWSLSTDVKNKKSLSILLYKTLKDFPYDHYDVGTTTVLHREESKLYRVFLQSYPAAVFALYEFCKTEMFEHIRFSIRNYQKNYGGLIPSGDIGQTRSVLEYLQNLCISNDGYEDFRRRSRNLDPWSHNTSDEDIWRHTIQHAPQMIPKMYKLVPLKTPQLAFVFVANLMKFSRVSELATFLSMKSGPKFVKLFNELDDKLKCEKIVRLFLDHIYDTACDVSMLELFVKYGAKLPKRLIDDYGKERASFQYEKTDTLKFFMKHHIVKIGHLFPDLFSVHDPHEGRYRGCIHSTVENLRWVIEELGPSSGKTKEMVGILAENLTYDDRKEFLPVYKHWCAEAGVTPNEYTRFITEILKRDSWSELVEHFDYRFGTDFPSLDQVATVSTVTRGYSDRKEKLFVRRIERDSIKISKRLVMRYGPQFFLAELTSERTHHGMNSSRSWFVLAYWLWQICHNSETPCRAAWQLPIPIIDKIESYVSCELSYEEKERDDANRKEEFMRYAKLRAAFPGRFAESFAKYGDGMHFYE